MLDSNVCTVEPLSKDRFMNLLRQAWSRVTAKPEMTQMRMAGLMDLANTAPIKRALSQSNLPEAHTIFNSLIADPTALDEVLSAYGFRISLRRPEAANDMVTLSGLCDAAGELAEALKDGVRVHPETLRVAEKLRPHMPALISIIREADELRAVAP